MVKDSKSAAERDHQKILKIFVPLSNPEASISNQITFIVTSPQHKCLGEWNSYERAPDSEKKIKKIKQFTFTFTFTFMHLADAFIQSDLQLHSGYTFLLVHMYY